MLELDKVLDDLFAQFDGAATREIFQAFVDQSADLLTWQEGQTCEEYLTHLFEMSTLYYAFKKKEEALSHWEHYIEVSNDYEIPNPVECGQILLFMGNALEQDLKFSEAFSQYETYLKFARKHLDLEAQATGNYKLGKMLFYQGAYTRSLECVLEALQFEKDLETSTLVEYLSTLSGIYVRLGEFAKAEEVADRVEKLIENQDDGTTGLISLYNIKAIAYQEQNQLNKAISHLRQVIVWENERYPKSESMVIYLNNLAQAYQRNLQFKDAEAILSKAMMLAEEILNPNHLRHAELFNSIANNLYGQGRLKEAIEQLKKADNILTLHNENLHSKASLKINNAALYYDLKEYEKSISNLLKARLWLEKELPWHHEENGNLLEHLALAYEATGQFDNAQIEYEKARDIYQKQLTDYFRHLSQAEKAQFFFKVFHFYQMFLSFLWRRARETSDPQTKNFCFAIAAESKSFLLQEAIHFHKTIRLIDQEEVKHKLSRLNQLRTELQGSIKEGKKVFEAVAEEINQLEKELAQHAKLPGVKELNEIMACLNKGEVLIEVFRINYFGEGISEEVKYLFFVIDERGLNLLDLDHYQQMEGEGIEHYLEHLSMIEKDTESWNIFWQPLTTVIASHVEKIWLVPDGVYNRLNLNTLYDPIGKSYLKDQLQIHYLTSSSDLERAQTITENSSGVGSISVFYPMSEPETKGYLSGGQAEVKTIKETFGESPIRYFKSKQANSTNFLDVKNTDLLHVITHGYFNHTHEAVGKLSINVHRSLRVSTPPLSQPMYNSGLIMNSDSGTEELSAYHISTMQLDETELVVLSACESGLGELIHGGGSYGLVRAFRIAGAKKIVASLWQVSDEATSLFMGSFYRAHAENSDATKAFAVAQDKTQQIYPEPYFWGGFIMYH